MSTRKKIIYWVFTLWLSLGMISTGLIQLLGKQEGAGAAASVTHLGYPLYLLTILGVCKLLGVVAVLIPKFPLLKEWTYAGFFFMMMGALVSHLAMGDSLMDMLPSLLMLALIGLSWYFRPADRKTIR